MLERPGLGAQGTPPRWRPPASPPGSARSGCERIIALAYPMNAASIRVMQKCGMRPAGTLQAHGHDLVCYEASGLANEA